MTVSTPARARAPVVPPRHCLTGSERIRTLEGHLQGIREVHLTFWARMILLKAGLALISCLMLGQERLDLANTRRHEAKLAELIRIISRSCGMNLAIGRQGRNVTPTEMHSQRLTYWIHLSSNIQLVTLSRLDAFAVMLRTSVANNVAGAAFSILEQIRVHGLLGQISAVKNAVNLMLAIMRTEKKQARKASAAISPA